MSREIVSKLKKWAYIDGAYNIDIAVPEEFLSTFAYYNSVYNVFSGEYTVKAKKLLRVYKRYYSLGVYDGNQSVKVGRYLERETERFAKVLARNLKVLNR